MEGIYNLYDDKLSRLEKAVDHHSEQIEETKNVINAIKEKLAAWAVYFAIFNFIANSDDYNYLKELRPLYIKASKFFLLESRQSLNMLKILTQSLDIKLVATSVDEIEEIKTLEEIGINAISGSVMSKL
jgi:EAL domain-containing protein (putative c-di-GMP-specific phosphodiesterase class I)